MGTLKINEKGDGIIFWKVKIIIERED